MIRELRYLLGFVCLTLFLSGGYSASVRADEYVKASHEAMVNTLIRFGAISIGDDLVIDDYAILNECKLFAKFKTDDFKWQRIREGIRQSIRQNVESYPTSYIYEAELQLDRYDFKEKNFVFKEKATIRNVNAFVIYSTEGKECANKPLSVLPRTYRAVLDQPIYFTGLPLAEKDGEALLNRMRDSGNRDRIVYARFKIRITYISPLKRVASNQASNNDNQPVQLEQDGVVGAVRMDARLDGLDIYEDEAHSRLIFSYQP